MAITLDCKSEKIISLEEYMDHAGRINLHDMDEVLSSGERLRELSNNKNFLVEKFNEELTTLNDFQAANSYSSQTLELGRGKHFLVRANMWVPRSGLQHNTDWEDHLFSYSFPHDHNYTFLTAGHYGPGYATTIYEYDPQQIVGYPGEQVDISFLEATTLSTGKVMCYRASRDIHSQEEPLDFSISINFLVFTPGIGLQNQFWFNTENNTIRGYFQNSQAARVMLCRLAKFVHNGRTQDLLASISKGHEYPRVRLTAYDALAAISPADASYVWQHALSDKDKLVQREAHIALSKIA